MKEIEALPVNQQLEVLSLLNSRLKNRSLLVNSIDEIRGIGKGIWPGDAQEFINETRENDRI